MWFAEMLTRRVHKKLACKQHASGRSHAQAVCIALARIIYIRCVYGNFGREITKYTVIFGACIPFWPILRKSTTERAPHNHILTPLCAHACTLYMHREWRVQLVSERLKGMSIHRNN